MDEDALYVRQKITLSDIDKYRLLEIKEFLIAILCDASFDQLSTKYVMDNGPLYISFLEDLILENKALLENNVALQEFIGRLKKEN